MSSEYFKAILRDVISEAVEVNRDRLLAVFSSMTDEETARQLKSIDFHDNTRIAIKYVLDNTLNRMMLEMVDKAVVDRLQQEDIAMVIRDAARKWVESKDFERFISDRVVWTLRLALSDIMADRSDEDDEDEGDND